QKVLGLEKISVKDDFFSLGGHSLKLTRLASMIYKEFEVRVAIKDLFEATTLEAQAKQISLAKTCSFIEIAPAPLQASYPLSSSQHMLWVASQLEEANVAYNMPAVYIFRGNLNKAALEYAFDTLVTRHEILRTVFREDEHGEVKQFIQSPEKTNFKIAELDLRKKKDREEKVRGIVASAFKKPFNLAEGPLFGAGLYQVEDHEWVFTYV